MKIVLSRKGFDSSAGGHASPILPNGTMISLPIPSPLDALAYSDIAIDGDSGRLHRTYADLIRELDAGARLRGGAHLDPDLCAPARPRPRGWRPTFGQIGAAGGHLRNERIGAGDLFLFFGWFRRTENVDARLRFARGEAGFHAVFGYLEVGVAIDATGRAPLPSWLRDHPHAQPRRRVSPNNTIYVSSDTLSIDRALPGAAAFRFDESLVLTKSGEARSRWRLDRDVFADVRISHHGPDAWRDGAFHSCKRGQEFVIDANARVIDWAARVIRAGATTAAPAERDARSAGADAYAAPTRLAQCPPRLESTNTRSEADPARPAGSVRCRRKTQSA